MRFSSFHPSTITLAPVSRTGLPGEKNGTYLAGAGRRRYEAWPSNHDGDEKEGSTSARQCLTHFGAHWRSGLLEIERSLLGG